MNARTVETEADLQTLLRPESERTFRGQSNASWKLESTLERAAKNNYGETFRQYLSEFEACAIDQFIDRCKRLELDDLYRPNTLPDGSDTFQWLSLMQHHGRPTRLIAFTDDVCVALYFALRGANPSIPFAIYELQMLPGDDAGNKLPKDSNGQVYRVPAGSGL